jgi:hypothetical protein
MTKENDNSIVVKMIEKMQKLGIKDGDIVVLKHPGRLTEAAVKGIKESLGFLKDWKIKKVVVLEEGMDIGVLTHEEGEK